LIFDTPISHYAIFAASVSPPLPKPISPLRYAFADISLFSLMLIAA